jgi:hypothetical protein
MTAREADDSHRDGIRRGDGFPRVTYLARRKSIVIGARFIAPAGEMWRGAIVCSDRPILSSKALFSWYVFVDAPASLHQESLPGGDNGRVEIPMQNS